MPTLKFLFFFISIILFSCTKKVGEQPPPAVQSPTISDFNPQSGAPGIDVTITGTNFSATISDDDVEFNGVKAVLKNATNTTLTVTIPQGATSGKITVNVNSKSATSMIEFRILTGNWTQMADMGGPVRERCGNF